MPDIAELSFEDRLPLLLEREKTDRKGWISPATN